MSTPPRAGRRPLRAPQRYHYRTAPPLPPLTTLSRNLTESPAAPPGFPRESGVSYNNITTKRNPAIRGDWREKNWVPAYPHSPIARTEPNSVRFWKSIFSLGNPDFRRRDPRLPWVVYLPILHKCCHFFNISIILGKNPGENPVSPLANPEGSGRFRMKLNQ